MAYIKILWEWLTSWTVRKTIKIPKDARSLKEKKFDWGQQG